ncbi:MAG: hypothetical protein AB8B60_11675 [Sulfitobacter sp.]
MGRLDGKVAVITQGTDDIGKAAGERFAKEGCQITLVSRRVAAGESTAGNAALIGFINALGAETRQIMCGSLASIHRLPPRILGPTASVSPHARNLMMKTAGRECCHKAPQEVADLAIMPPGCSKPKVQCGKRPATR